MPVNLVTSTATGTNLYGRVVTYTPESNFYIYQYTKNIKISVSFYVGYAAYHNGREYGFEVKLYDSEGTSYSKDVWTAPDSSRGYVEATFTIGPYYSQSRITSVTLEQTDRYSSSYNANNRTPCTINMDSYDTLYTNVNPASNLSVNRSSAYPGQTGMKLTWSAGSGGINTSVLNYVIQRSTNGGSWSNWQTVSGTEYQFTADSTNNTSYSYQVIAKSTPSGYDASASNTVSLSVAVSAPTAPGNPRLDATYLSPGASTTFRWDVPSSAGTNNSIAQYQVAIDNVDQTAIANTTTAYNVTAASPSGTRKFKVKALGSISGWNSGYSAEVTLYTFTSPGAPKSVYVSPVEVAPGSNATLGWSAANAGDYNAIAHYDVYRSENPTSGYTKINSSPIAANNTGTYTYGVTAHSTKGSVYYYKVYAVGQRGGETASSYVTLTSYNYSTVGAPTGLSLSPTIVAYNGSATLTWQSGAAGTHTAISSYQVFRSTDLVNWGDPIAQVAAPTVQATVSTSGYARGTIIYYTVKSIANISGYDSALSTDYASLKVNEAPGKPANVTATPTLYETGNITVTWDASSDPEGDTNLTYKVDYQTNDTGNWVTFDDWSTERKAEAPLTIARGSYVKFRVQSKDAYGDTSPYSDASNAVTRNTAPSTDALTFVKASGTGITYAKRPRILLTLSGDSDKTLSVYADGYTGTPSGSNPVGTKMMFYPNTDQSTGNHTITFTVTEQHGATTAITYTYNRGTVTLEDPNLVQYVTKVKAVHVSQIRTYINTIRSFYGLSSYNWSRTVIGGTSKLKWWKSDIEELKAAIDDTIYQINNWVTGTSVGHLEPMAWTTLTANCPRVDIMSEIRSALDKL